ncbi:MAG: TRAP transporter small permease subunit [Clostridiales Family XIII bacterium]|jgi:TRAP-type mannitol/chloroaromatic compound transport system permease small subunit|nr:TRAP transporter small permease subunit [Clostridiales Family XIII bacterium]
MKIMKKIISIVDKINLFVGNVVKFLLLYMALTLFYEVIARYVFNNPTIWVLDLAKLALGFMGILGGGYAMLLDSHVKVDVIYGARSVRTRAIMDLCTSILFFIFIIILLWQSTRMALASFVIREHSTTVFAPPLYPLKMAIPVGVGLVLFQGIAKVLRDIIALITNEEQGYENLQY